MAGLLLSAFQVVVTLLLTILSLHLAATTPRMKKLAWLLGGVAIVLSIFGIVQAFRIEEQKTKAVQEQATLTSKQLTGTLLLNEQVSEGAAKSRQQLAEVQSVRQQLSQARQELAETRQALKQLQRSQDDTRRAITELVAQGRLTSQEAKDALTAPSHLTVK